MDRKELYNMLKAPWLWHCKNCGKYIGQDEDRYNPVLNFESHTCDTGERGVMEKYDTDLFIRNTFSLTNKDLLKERQK